MKKIVEGDRIFIEWEKEDELVKSRFEAVMFTEEAETEVLETLVKTLINNVAKARQERSKQWEIVQDAIAHLYPEFQWENLYLSYNWMTHRIEIKGWSDSHE